MGPLAIAALLAAAAGELPLVGDFGPVIELEPAGLSFRTPEHGYLFTTGAEVFATHDGGRSWTPATALQKNRSGVPTWLDADVGIAVGGGPGRLVRSVDAGASWQLLSRPNYGRIASLDHVADQLWICTQSGSVAVSDDRGTTWTELDSPFAMGDYCSSLSFVDRRDGWIAGHEHTLYVTHDGGKTWAPLAPPETPQGGPMTVFRIDGKRAWIVTGGDRLFSTEDGGATWQDRGKESRAPQLLAVRHVVRETESRPYVASLAPAEHPWFAGTAAARGTDDLLSASLSGLQLWRERRLEEEWLVAGPPPGPERLEGTGTLPHGEAFGWAGKHVYRRPDAKAAWYLADTLPDRISFIASPIPNRLVLRTTDDRIFATDDLAHHWEPSDSAETDAYDLEILRGSSPKPVHPFACLDDATSASLVIETQFSWWDTNRVDVSWDRESGLISGTFVTPDEARARARQLLAATRRPEEPDAGRTETETIALVHWSCGRGQGGHEARFVAPTCGFARSRDGSGPPAGWHGPRACELRDAVRASLGTQRQPAP